MIMTKASQTMLLDAGALTVRRGVIAMARDLQHLALLALTFTLAACGGAGSEVASIPAPLPAPAPAPPSPGPGIVMANVVATTIPTPATEAGIAGTIALVESAAIGVPRTYRQTASPNEVQIERGGGAYTLLFNAADIPASSSEFQFGDRIALDQFVIAFGQHLDVEYVRRNSDGTTTLVDHAVDEYRRGESTIETASGPSTRLRQTLVYDVGLSSVALGEWAWRTVQVQADGSSAEGPPLGRIPFVHGDRTPAAAIPASGTASYTAASLGYGVQSPVLVALTADFGQRSISAQLDRDGSYTGDYYGGDTVLTLGVDLRGTGSIASPGSFSIPLTGTVTDVSVIPNGVLQVTGSLDGAFFGPSAEQVGGVFAVGRAPGEVLVSDAFVGVRN